MTRFLVAGAGIFGVTAALELRRRGHEVTLVDPGPVPHPLAESTDISKVVRVDYGADEDYTLLGERSLEGWRRWNAGWPAPLFHETGVAFLARAPMQPGGFEHDSYVLLSRRGHRLERLDAADIARRFPAYRPGAFVDGYTHANGGWVASGAVVARLAAEAVAAGVELRIAHVTRILDDGVLVEPAGEHLAAEAIVVATGAWAAELFPDLAVRPVGQPVFHLRPADPSPFEAPRFPVFGADIARTGYYGFPVNDGVVKIANHGTGVVMAPGVEREVTPEHEAALRAFLAGTFPALATAPIVGRRLCVYGDTPDTHFWIARHPERPHVTIATGGSGHAFKFAPELGPLIADVALGIAHPLAGKFGAREAVAERGDAARKTKNGDPSSSLRS
jgi:glycine/D-amino acid oxidase-like deaminating enzyme